MPDLVPIQESFAYGVLSPRLFNRPSTDRYQQGAGWCRNFLPLSHGPLRMRNGSRYVAPLEETDPNLTLIPYELTPLSPGVLVIGSEAVQLFDQRGAVTHGPNDLELIQNGHFDANRNGWRRVTPHATCSVQWDSRFRAMQLVSGGTQADRWVAAEQRVEVLDTTGVVHTLSYSVHVIDDAGATDLGFVEITATDRTQIVTAPLVQGNEQGLSFSPVAADIGVVVRFVVNPTGATVNIEDVSCKKFNTNRTLARWISPYTNYDRLVVQWGAPPNANSIWIAHPNVRPYELSFDGVDTYNFAPISFTGQPAHWGAESWPASVTFHQQRSWWGGAPNAPETLNSSQTGDFTNLTTGTLANEGMQYTLAERGAVAWLKGAKTLIVGTENAEYIAESDGAALVPGDLELRKQSAYGSPSGQTEDIGDRVIYVSGDETKLRTMSYEWTRDAWVSVDLAWPSEHLTEGKLERVVYMKNPESALISTESGSPFRLLVCMYNREQSIIGWSDIETAGLYRGVAATPFLGISVPWVAVQRQLGDDRTVLYLERFSSPYKLDCHVEKSYDQETKQIIGLEALEGVECTVLLREGAELATHPKRTVTNGQIELQIPTKGVILGFGYKAAALSLPIGSQNQQLVNVASRVKRWSKVYARLAASAKPRIAGVAFFDALKALRNGLPVPGVAREAERLPATPMNTSEPVEYEDTQVASTAWDVASAVYVEQDLPVDTTIVGIFGEMGVGSLDQ